MQKENKLLSTLEKKKKNYGQHYLFISKNPHWSSKDIFLKVEGIIIH